MRTCHDVPERSVVFLRAGMDVPLEHGQITDPSRIEETRPTIDVLRAKHCRIVIATKVGRPKGVDPSLSTKPVAEYLKKFYPTKYVSEVIGITVLAAISELEAGELLVLENLLFDAREEAGDDVFAQELVVGCDVIVQDAYASCHRSQASIVAIAKHKPAYAGLLLEKELLRVTPFIHPDHPYVAIIGGAKADKLSTIRGLLKTVDSVLVGGALANTFLKAAGFPVGNSKVDAAGLVEASELLQSGKIILPIDAVVAQTFAEDAKRWTCDIGAVENGMILDIGAKTVERYATVLRSARTIVWGGPIGVFEWDAFSAGTKGIAQEVADATTRGAKTLAAGGDSGAALVALGYKDKVTHVSTGGGVTLELLEGKKLPGVVALEENSSLF